MVEQIICVVIVMTTLIIIVFMVLLVSIIRMKYIKDTAKEAAKTIKDSTKSKPSEPFSEDSIRKLIREEIIKLMR